MSAVISPPYLRWLARLLRVSLRVLGAALALTVLAWAVLNAWIVPRIDHWRPEIAHWASQRLGVRVDIARIQGGSNGWRPRFVLEGVALRRPGDGADARPALQFDELRVAVTPWSLWQWSLDELRAVRPMLDVRRDMQGQFWVGGFALSTENADTPPDLRWLDWLLGQRHIQIEQGSVRWLDERLASQRPDAGPLLLRNVDLSLANQRHRHRLALAATPPQGWGSRFTWQADLRTPLWAVGDARQLGGQVFASFPSLDVAALRRHVDADIELQAAQGAVRAWFDLRRSRLQRATLDLDVQRMAARFAKDLTPLDLRDVAGRLVWQVQGDEWGMGLLPFLNQRKQIDTTDGFVLTGEGLRFATADGQRWSDAAVRVAMRRGAAGADVTETGEVRASRVNLAALRQVLTALPLDAALRDALRAHPVSGRVQQLQASWARPAASQPLRYAAKGEVQALAVAAAPRGRDAAGEEHIGVPGIRGANVAFDLSERGGQARLRMQGGSASFPGVFAEPEVPLDELSADVDWTIAGEHGEDLALHVKHLALRNADAQGSFQARWHTRPAASLAEGESRFPGELDLSGELQRANGARVYRYLPLVVGEHALRYVKEAVVAGQARGVKVAVRGDLRHFPFPDSRQGLFRIVAPVQQVRFDYVPRYLQDAHEPAWPMLENLAGSLEFEGDSMRVRGASGQVSGFAGIRFGHIEADIPRLEHPEVRVRARGSSDAAAGLRFVRQSPVSPWLHGALDGMQATGAVGLELELALPIAHIHESRVKGEVRLQGNTLRLRDDVPVLSEAQGRIAFSETGFALHEARAQALGGAVSLSGGTQPGAAMATVIEAEGQATVAGLRADPMMQSFTPALAYASGAAGYRVHYAVQDGHAEVEVTSGLRGLGLDLPAPLHKAPDAEWPLRVAIVPRGAAAQAGGADRVDGAGTASARAGTELSEDELQVTLADLVQARYQRRHEASAQGERSVVTAGLLGLGRAAAGVAQAPLPRAVGLRAELDAVDLDAWRRVFQGQPATAAAPAVPASAPAQASAGAPVAKLDESAVSAFSVDVGNGGEQYLPVAFDVQAHHVQLEGKGLTDLRLRGTHQGGEWAMAIESDVLAGQVRYRDDGAGRLHARLTRLHVPEDSAAPEPDLVRQAPSRLPGMDLAVQDLRLGDKQLGAFVFQAANRGEQGGRHVWQIEKMSLAGPGGTLTAHGAWQPADAQGRRHTELNFTLAMDDAGRLLARLGLPGVLSRGHGDISGALSWAGSPLLPDAASLDGQVKVEVLGGQFLKADPGLAKLLGVLSLQSLPRRLALDFRDVFSDGFAYDFIRGDARLKRGVATTNNLQMKGVQAAVLLEGQADLAQATQDLRVVVAPRIDAGGAALVATVINPAVGVGAFLAQLVLGKQISEANTRVFHITGTWADPEVQRVPAVPGVDRAAAAAGEAPAASPASDAAKARDVQEAQGAPGLDGRPETGAATPP